MSFFSQLTNKGSDNGGLNPINLINPKSTGVGKTVKGSLEKYFFFFFPPDIFPYTVTRRFHSFV